MALGNHNNVEYQLYSDRQGWVTIPEPINYEEGNGNIYERDEESKGIMQVKSNQLELHGEAFPFLLKHNFMDGLDDVKIVRRSKDRNRLDERWRVDWEAYLDTGELQFDEKRNVVKTKFAQGGLANLIDTRKNEEYDLINTESVDGKNLRLLQTNRCLLPSRKIFLRSRFEAVDGYFIKSTNSNSNRNEFIPVPFNIDYNSDQDNLQSVVEFEMDEKTIGGTKFPGNGREGNILLQRSTTNKVLNLKGQIKFSLDGAQSLERIKIYIVRYGTGEDPRLPVKEYITLYNEARSKGQTVEYTFDNYELRVEKDESIAIVVGIFAQGKVHLTFEETELIVEEDSVFPPTSCRVVSAFNLFDRLLGQITGELGRFRSDLFTTGKLKDDLLTVGWWIRNFPDVINQGTDEERRIQFKTSFKQAFEAFEAQMPLCWFIEVENNKEYLRIEELNYAQQNNVTIRYGKTTFNVDGTTNFDYIEPQEVTRRILPENYYSSIEIGSNKGGDGYEEVFGLQSFSGKAQFETINKRKESPYVKLAEYSFGDVDIEIPRRKQYSDYPETDTKYDDVISVIKGKFLGRRYTVKQWEDIYEQVPLNVYDPDTAYNLELTPAQLLLNHGYNIMPGLIHRPGSSVRWISSNCNSSLITKKAGEDPLQEDGTIAHTRFGNPRIRPRTVDFTLKVDQDVEDQINGFTNGIPNWYGLVAVKIEGAIEYFRIIKTDTNKEGTHKLVEASL